MFSLKNFNIAFRYSYKTFLKRSLTQHAEMTDNNNKYVEQSVSFTIKLQWKTNTSGDKCRNNYNYKDMSLLLHNNNSNSIWGSVLILLV